MIQFNLLPDVKLEYVKTQRTKRMLTTVSIVVSLVSIVVLMIAIVGVNVVQKKSLNDLDADIDKYSKELKSVKDLDNILTVQNQLSTLTGLHDDKAVASRLFAYISELTPPQAGLNLLTVDFASNTMTMGGEAPSQATVSVYTDTLKKTTYATKTITDKPHAFSNVVLSSFARTQAGATFTITCSFDPAIFDSAETVKFTVPQTAGADQSSVFEGSN